MRVHLINPSDTAFGTAVITPRWLYVLAAATPESFGTPLIVDETLDQLDPETVSAATWSGSASTRATPAWLPARARWCASGGHGRLRRHPLDALPRGGARARRRARGGQRRRRPGVAQVLRDCAAARRSRCTTAGALAASSFLSGALGPDAGRSLHVGIGADRARLPQALLVLFGVEDRRPAAAPADVTTWSKRSSAAAPGLPLHRCWPTTTSIRSRWRTWRGRAGARTRAAARARSASARSASS